MMNKVNNYFYIIEKCWEWILNAITVKW
jgi:hypothetical protein